MTNTWSVGGSTTWGMPQTWHRCWDWRIHTDAQIYSSILRFRSPHPWRASDWSPSMILSPSCPGSAAYIIDWKTSRKPPARQWLDRRMQTHVYPFLLAAAGGHFNAGVLFQPGHIEMIYWFAEHPDEDQRFPYRLGEIPGRRSYSKIIDFWDPVPGRDGICSHERSQALPVLHLPFVL